MRLKSALRRGVAAAVIAGIVVSSGIPAYAARWDIANGDITVKAGDTEGTNKVTQGETIDKDDTNTVITGESDKNTVTIDTSKGDVDVTFDDLKIDISGKKEGDGSGDSPARESKAAVTVQGDHDATIELDGKNELKSGNLKAGLEKNTSEGTLTLKDDKEAGSGSLTAEGGGWAAGIGGSDGKGTNNIIISGGTVTAEGGNSGAGIGGGYWGRGRNITVSGAAQVTTTAGKSDGFYGAGATIGNGGNYTNGENVDGEEIQADISGLTTGYIYHKPQNSDGSQKQEWWEFGHLQPAPDTPNAPAEESNEVSLGTPGLHVETLEGSLLPFDARRQGSTLRVTSNTLAARLHGTRQALEALREQGVEQIQFVTSLKTTTLPVGDLLAEGGSWFALEHNGLVSRQLSAAQAESLKCRMR